MTVIYIQNDCHLCLAPRVYQAFATRCQLKLDLHYFFFVLTIGSLPSSGSFSYLDEQFTAEIDLFTNTAAILILPPGHPIILD